MQRLFSALLVVGLAGFHLASLAQQTPSPAPPDTAQPESIPQHRNADSPDTPQSARAFNGKILRAGNQFLLKDSNAHTSYKLDDQNKAKQYEGKRVKVMATMDSTSNVLHVIDIIDFAKSR